MHSDSYTKSANKLVDHHVELQTLSPLQICVGHKYLVEGILGHRLVVPHGHGIITPHWDSDEILIL